MAPQFALSLSMHGIRLLAGDSAQMGIVGEVSLEAEDLSAALADLRAQGEKIAGGPFECALILPDDQIKYLQTQAASAEEVAACKALEGATPYDLDDLVFDWVRDGDQLFVAAVAKETLAEAEGFARANGFTPSGVAAYPEADLFPARPVFGASAALSRGEALPELTESYTPPAPPPPFATRREAPPLATVPDDPDAASTAAPPVAAPARITLSGLNTTGSGAPSLGAATPPAPQPAPAVTGESGATVVAETAPQAAAVASSKPENPLAPKASPKRTDKAAKRDAQIGGKPRYLGLMLTAGLVVILVLVALWSLTLGDEEETAAAPETAAIAPETDEDTAPRVTAIVPRQITPGETNEPTSEQTAVASLPDIDAPTEVLLPDLEITPPPVLPTAEEVAEIYDAKGIWVQAPRQNAMPRANRIDDFYMASIDPNLSRGDAVALPPLGALGADGGLSSLAPPAAAGAEFALGPDGLVVPSAEGTLSPDGILVFAGRPPVTVPTRPQAQDPAEAEPAPEDNRLAALRPNARPTNLSDARERAQLGGRTLAELATIRPKARPKAEQELAAEVAAAAASAAAAVINAPQPEPPTGAEAEPQDPFAGASQLASATSFKPRTRPRNFARVVEQARARAAEPRETGRVVQAVAPRSVRPSGPVPTTVARAATVDNAINLRRINLIGVYGKPASRRALVRLKNGRLQKLSVGDRLDGGRVSAIGESELRYTKRGRDVTLRIPSS